MWQIHEVYSSVIYVIGTWHVPDWVLESKYGWTLKKVTKVYEFHLFFLQVTSEKVLNSFVFSTADGRTLWGVDAITM